jgi:RimJ/RimL family protein N-acetyltransferase
MPTSAPDAFTTPRLAWERLRPAHFDDILAMHQDPRQMEWLGGVRDAEATRAYLERNLAHWDAHGFGLWMLRDRADGRMVGRGLLRTFPLEGVDEVEIGYGLHPDHWGKGLATEVAAACVEMGRTTLGRGTLVAVTHPGNVASHRVLLKAGFAEDQRRDEEGGPQLIFRWRAGAA